VVEIDRARPDTFVALKPLCQIISAIVASQPLQPRLVARMQPFFDCLVPKIGNGAAFDLININLPSDRLSVDTLKK